MQILIDADVVLYMAVHSAETETLDACIERFEGIIKDVGEMHFAAPENIELFLSSNGENFRKQTYPSYKANRKKITPPTHLAALKDWVFDNIDNVKGSPGGEADDFLLIRAAELDEEGTPWCICSVDKDLKTRPGRFYNLRRRDWETVTPDDAYTFMVQQFVQGDAGDSIAGLRGWGPKKTEKLINKHKTLKANYEESKKIWKNQYGTGWQAPFNLTCNTAFIRRDSCDLLPLDFARMQFPTFFKKLRICIPD
jgi:5'-3' exonuclease